MFLFAFSSEIICAKDLLLGVPPCSPPPTHAGVVAAWSGVTWCCGGWAKGEGGTVAMPGRHGRHGRKLFRRVILKTSLNGSQKINTSI